MSLQVTVSGPDSDIEQWTVIDLYTWIAQYSDTFGLNQDDLDSIEESPLTGKQMIQKDDEQLSQEWAISIHAARKIVQKISQIKRKPLDRNLKRNSEPIISMMNGNNNNNNNEHHVLFQTPLKDKNGSKVSVDPNLENIPEGLPSASNYYPTKVTPRYTSSLVYNDSAAAMTQIKLTLSITNDTYMGRLSHPKWWMDGHFNHIPNKIDSKHTVSIDITGDFDTPLVGLLSFTLTLDPRYMHQKTSANKEGHYAFSPYFHMNPHQMPHIPQWMIGPSGLPYIPPSVMRMYELQHECMNKMIETAKEKQHKEAERQRKHRKKADKKRIKQNEKQQRLAIKLEKRKLKRLEREKKQREQEAAAAAQKSKNTTDNDEITPVPNDAKDDIIAIVPIITDNNSVVEKESESEDESSDESDESTSESTEDGDIHIEEPPKYRLIILWSIAPKTMGKNGKMKDDIAQNSMAFMSVASSDLLHTMNRFNVLLLEDDTDPTAPDEFNLDNSYFNELEQAALIADIEQCLVEHEHFEIAATFGTSPMLNEYKLQVDIDDSLGDWPLSLHQLYSNNPFAVGFMPTNQRFPIQQTPYTPYTPSPYPGTPNAAYPDITMIPPRAKSGLLPPTKRRRRSNSNPVAQPGIPEAAQINKFISLDDVLTESRSPIPSSRGALGANTLSPDVGLGAFPKYKAPLRRKISSKAPRLSFWKEQMSNLTEYREEQHHHHQSHSRNLYVPQRRSHTRNSSPSTSPQVPQSTPQLEHALSAPVHVQYNIGDCVFVDDSKIGQIKSIGQHPAWGQGTWYGIRLTEKIGNCDGDFKGQRTFSCPPGFGFFVQRNQLTQKLKTTRFDFMNEDYIEDKKKEFQNLKAAKDHEQFAAEIRAQKQHTHYDASEDEDPGESDIPKPGTNVSQVMGQSSSERILTKNKPAGKYVAKQDKHPKKETQDKPQRRKSKTSVIPRWTGGAPRTVVVRNKIPPIKEHAGYLHCKEGVEHQRQMEWKKAIEKFKLGIALLEVTLMAIDRSMVKRKWKAVIEEFRHKMSRCTFEIQNNKRNRFIKKRDKIAKKQAQVQAQAALVRQAEKMSDAKSKVMKREDHWKVTREDMEKKVAENEIDPNYDPSTGIRKSDAFSDSDNSDEINSGRIGGDKALAKAKKEHRKNKKKKKGKNKDDWSNFPGYENSNNKKDESGSEEDDDDDKKKDSKLSKHDKELRSRIEGDVMSVNPNLSFADVIGLNNVKLALYETIILPYIRPDLFESVSKSTQGLLLFGPPGNGKTMIAKCVASQCDATFFSISASSITSKFVGEAERIMRTLFVMARQRAPSIIFIDEIDSLLRTRGAANEAESSRRVKTEFLIQFDGVKSSESSDKTITIIGATNLPDQLDDAVLRRFPKRIMVPNPDPEARYSLIRLLASKHRHNMTEEGFRQLAKDTNHYSCSDIAMLCSDAVMGPIRSMRGSILLKAKKSDIPKINLSHFQDSIKNVRASCAPEALQHYYKWDKQFGSKLFLTMDVLPENMKQTPLPSVEEEKKKKTEAEEAVERQKLLKEEEILEREKQKREKERLAIEEEERQAQKEKEKQRKLLKINTPTKIRRKSDQMFKPQAHKRGSKSSSYEHANDNHSKKRNSSSFSGKPKVLNTKTFKISTEWNPKTKTKSTDSDSSRKKGHRSSPSVDSKLFNSSKRSSKSSGNRKKKTGR